MVEDWITEWLGLAKKINSAISTSNSYLNKIHRFVNDISNKILNIETEVKNSFSKLETYLPKLESLDTSMQNAKNLLDDMKTKFTNIDSTLSTAKSRLEDITKYTAGLPEVQGDISNLKTNIIDIKNKIASYLPNLSKLESLSTLQDKLDDLTGAINNINFTLPENINIENTEVVNEIKNLSGKFEEQSKKLALLENINENLINQLTLQQYSINLINQNLPLAQEYLGISNRFLKLNDLGFKLVSLQVTPDEYFNRFMEIMSESFQVKAPSIPEFKISRPTVAAGSAEAPYSQGDIVSPDFRTESEKVTDIVDIIPESEIKTPDQDKLIVDTDLFETTGGVGAYVDERTGETVIVQSGSSTGSSLLKSSSTNMINWD